MLHDDDHELGRRVAESYREVGVSDPDARARLMERLRREPEPRRAPIMTWNREEWGLNAWRPALATAAVALIVGVALGWVLHDRLRSGMPPAPVNSGLAQVPSTREVRLVQFVLTAPKASHVAVVGDFNEWDPAATPMVRRDGGAWTAAIPVAPGRHVYAFIVDGDRWVSDPAAPLAPEDGFGIRNSVIVVGGQEST